MLSFDGSFKKRPDQFVNKLNEQSKQQESERNSKWVYNQDSSKVIIIGQQPSPPTPVGTFGIRAYDVFGDRLVQTAVIL